MMSVTELERFGCKQGGKGEKVGNRIPAKEKGSWGNKACIETEEEIVCKVEKNRKRKIRKGLEELDKEKAALDEMVSQVRRHIL